MQITILDSKFESIDIMDVMKSLIWNERYDQYGDFELYAPYDETIFNEIDESCYIQLDNNNHLMMCEKKLIETDPEDGNFMTISGNSLESLLCRRVVAKFTVLSGNLQDGIQKILNENIIAPTDAKRKIDRFRFERTDDPYICGLTIEGQFLGDNLHDLISTLCVKHHIGFQITLSDDNHFVFKLYNGVDRSYDQTTNSYVVFSPDYENLSNTTYVDDRTEERNSAIISGEGEGASQKVISIGESSGLSRREIYVNASYVSSTVNDTTLSPEEYSKQLAQKGSESLSDYLRKTEFEGTAEALQMYTLGQDFFLGDIVQIENEYGMEASSRVTGIIRSYDDNGASVLPKFSAIKNERERSELACL